MPLLLKDCGLDGCKGTIQHCPECHRSTAHFARPGARPVCGRCSMAQPGSVTQRVWSMRAVVSSSDSYATSTAGLMR
jgi:hypothetical protein